MAQVKITHPDAKNCFDTVYNKSSKFQEVVCRALDGGDIQYILTDSDRSFYDHKQRTISSGLKSGDRCRMDSDIIFEMCNAYYEHKGSRRPMEDFAEAEEYGIETERSEWRSVKKHYEVITELETKDKAWGLLNRFKPGFERKDKSWHEFDNYYNDQKDSGHTLKNLARLKERLPGRIEFSIGPYRFGYCEKQARRYRRDSPPSLIFVEPQHKNSRFAHFLTSSKHYPITR